MSETGLDGRSIYRLSPTQGPDPNMGTVVGRSPPSQAQRLSMIDNARWSTRERDGVEKTSLASAKTPRLRQDRILANGVRVRTVRPDEELPWNDLMRKPFDLRSPWCAFPSISNESCRASWPIVPLVESLRDWRGCPSDLVLRLGKRKPWGQCLSRYDRKRALSVRQATCRSNHSSH